ncbi:MAG: ASCH domain-containing protein [Vicinamibacterales bacterium]
MMTSIPALTVCQPYAHLIASGDKPVENRGWPTRYRGPLLIHAGKSRAWLDEGDELVCPEMAFGAFVAVVDLVACLPKAEPSQWGAWSHLLSHPHTHGAWCYVLENVRRIRPVPARGAQGLWRPDAELLRRVGAELAKVAPGAVLTAGGARG